MHKHIHTCDPSVPNSQPNNMHVNTTGVSQNQLPLPGVCISMAVKIEHKQLLRTIKQWLRRYIQKQLITVFLTRLPKWCMQG